MENNKSKKTFQNKVVTTENIENAFTEFQKGYERFKNNESGEIDHKNLRYTIKMANKAIKEMRKLHEETVNNEKIEEDLKKKNKDFLKKKMG